MFQAKLRGWKRLAASLMLLPGLTAVGVEVVYLLGSTRADERANDVDRPDDRPLAPIRPSNEDPRILVKKAREALEANRLEAALDLAKQAQANGRTAEWRLFEDTPESVLKDVMKALGRRDLQKAEWLTKEARRLFEQHSSPPKERAQNLDKAHKMCVDAMKLHGPYNMWHFGDRPDELLKEIDAVRSRQRADTTETSAGTATRPKSYFTPQGVKKDSVAATQPPPDTRHYVPPKGWDDSVNRPLPKKQPAGSTTDPLAKSDVYVPPPGSGWDAKDVRPPTPKTSPVGSGPSIGSNVTAPNDNRTGFDSFNNQPYPKNDPRSTGGIYTLPLTRHTDSPFDSKNEPAGSNSDRKDDGLGGGKIVSKTTNSKSKDGAWTPKQKPPIAKTTDVDPNPIIISPEQADPVTPRIPPVQVARASSAPDPEPTSPGQPEPIVTTPRQSGPVIATPDRPPLVVITPPDPVPNVPAPLIIQTPAQDDMQRLIPQKKTDPVIPQPPLIDAPMPIDPPTPIGTPAPVDPPVQVNTPAPTDPPLPVEAPAPNPNLQKKGSTPLLQPATAIETADMRNKAKAVELMQHASALCKDGKSIEKLIEARQVLLEAQKLNAPFGLDEEAPEQMLQSLIANVHKRINKLGSEAHARMVKKAPDEVAAAEKLLNDAEALALGFGLDPWAISSHRETLRSIKKSMSTGVAAAELPSQPEFPINKSMPAGVGVVPPPLAPSVDGGQQSVMPPNTPPMNVVQAPMVQAPLDPGMEMLRQARVELSNRQLDTARKIVAQVMNAQPAHREEAQALLRTIDAEETALKQATAMRAYDHAVEAFHYRNYEQAFSIFKQIDPRLLPASKQRLMADQMAAAARNIEKAHQVARVGAPDNALDSPVADKTGADSLVKQEEAMRELQFQKLRAEGLQLEATATARFGKGETDAALQDLTNYVARVKASSIDPAKVAMLTRPIEGRLERLRVLKHQQDYLTQEAKGLKDFRNQTNAEALYRENQKKEVAKMMKEFGKLMEEGKYEEAGKYAMMARQLDPNDPTVTAAMQISRMAYRKEKWATIRSDQEQLVLDGLNDASVQGPYADIKDPQKFDVKRFNEIRNRKDSSSGYGGSLRPLTGAEKKLESELNSRIVNLSFANTPLEEAIKYLQTSTALNFYLDTKALEAARINPKTSTVTLDLHNITLKSALVVLLRAENLTYVIDSEVIRITTHQGAQGKLVQRTIPVTDLVIPVQNFAPSSMSSLDSMLAHTLSNNRPNFYSGTPSTPRMSLPNQTAVPVGISSAQNRPGGGQLINNNAPPPSTNASGNPVTISGASGTIEESLIRLITNSVRPESWEAMGGAGRIEYYPLGMALVINQTPDVIEEVVRLLESLRQLQDLEIAIEVRMITLAETFYERIGLDFSMNVSTHQANAASNIGNSSLSNNNLTNVQNIPGSGKYVGLQAPNIPTPDLKFPIAPSSFGMAVPPFGNYPNAPGADGGLSLGLAFLSDIQVQMFLDAAQGDRRTNVMQAPKLTMFNGQSANISIQTQQFFLTGITVTQVNGTLVFTPQNSPFPLGVQMNMQPVVSGDRRFVRLNIQQQMTNLASATVPLFPITTIVTPVFDTGAQGQPVPFTQYIQQPSFTTISVSTTVVVPDGGTVLLGGLKTLNEGRNEFGPPVLSKIPYLSRLFRNVGYGRDTQSLMMMVTPRIIINREEQEKQTGVVENRGEEQ